MVLALMAILPSMISAMYPWVRNIKVSNVGFSNGCLVVSGTCTMYYDKVNYPNVTNEFYYFNQWWQQQAGKSYDGFTLVSIQWQLLQHTNLYDKLAFKIALR